MYPQLTNRSAATEVNGCFKKMVNNGRSSERSRCHKEATGKLPHAWWALQRTIGAITGQCSINGLPGAFVLVCTGLHHTTAANGVCTAYNMPFNAAVGRCNDVT